MFFVGIGCSTVVDHMPHYQDVMGLGHSGSFSLYRLSPSWWKVQT